MKKKAMYFLGAIGLASSLILSTPIYSKSEKNNLVESQLISETQKAQETVVNIENLKQLEGIITDNKYVALDFSATWCGYCKVYDPVFEAVAEKYKDKAVFARVVLDKMGKEESKKLIKSYDVKWIPKTMFFKVGQEVCIDSEDKDSVDYNGILGQRDEDELTRLVEKYLFSKE